jgi:hypothetical protein
MPNDKTLFDEWQLHWWIEETSSLDAEPLRNSLNSGPILSAIETAVQEVIRRTPALKPLSVTISR